MDKQRISRLKQALVGTVVQEFVAGIEGYKYLLKARAILHHLGVPESQEAQNFLHRPYDCNSMDACLVFVPNTCP